MAAAARLSKPTKINNLNTKFLFKLLLVCRHAEATCSICFAAIITNYYYYATLIH